MKKVIILLVVIVIIGGGVAAYFLYVKDKGIDLSIIGLGKAPESEKIAKRIKIEVPPEEKIEVPVPPPPAVKPAEVKPEVKKVEEVKPPPKAPVLPKKVEVKKVKPRLAASKLYKPWAVHVASYTSREEAGTLVEKLRQDKYNAYMTEFDFQGKHWYRVRIGFYDTEAQARGIGKKISASYNITGIWTVKPAWKEIKQHFDP